MAKTIGLLSMIKSYHQLFHLICSFEEVRLYATHQIWVTFTVSKAFTKRECYLQRECYLPLVSIAHPAWYHKLISKHLVFIFF